MLRPLLLLAALVATPALAQAHTACSKLVAEKVAKAVR